MLLQPVSQTPHRDINSKEALENVQVLGLEGRKSSEGEKKKAEKWIWGQ